MEELYRSVFILGLLFPFIVLVVLFALIIRKGLNTLSKYSLYWLVGTIFLIFGSVYLLLTGGDRFTLLSLVANISSVYTTYKVYKSRELKRLKK